MKKNTCPAPASVVIVAAVGVGVVVAAVAYRGGHVVDTIIDDCDFKKKKSKSLSAFPKNGNCYLPCHTFVYIRQPLS